MKHLSAIILGATVIGVSLTGSFAYNGSVDEMLVQREQALTEQYEVVDKSFREVIREVKNEHGIAEYGSEQMEMIVHQALTEQESEESSVEALSKAYPALKAENVINTATSHSEAFTVEYRALQDMVVSYENWSTNGLLKKWSIRNDLGKHLATDKKTTGSKAWNKMTAMVAVDSTLFSADK